MYVLLRVYIHDFLADEVISVGPYICVYVGCVYNGRQRPTWNRVTPTPRMSDCPGCSLPLQHADSGAECILHFSFTWIRIAQEVSQGLD
jgi:hypothetical protein